MHKQTIDRSHWMLALALILGLGLAFGLTTWASAQGGAPSAADAPSGTTITVNTEDDELNSDNDCSLREALQAANTDAAADACPAGNGWDTIMVPAGTYILTKAGAGEDANATGDLDVRDSVTILGADTGTTILDGNDSDRVFHVDPTGLGVVLDLRDVTVTNGSSDAGGGLRAANGLTRIQDSVFADNTATASGGAIQADLGTLRVLTSTIESNDAGATGQGGGIYVDLVALTIQGSTIEDNTAQEGGGLYNYYGSVTVQDTKVIRNTTVGTDTYGAGIYSEAGNLIVEAKSEISHNKATTTDSGGEGGGIWVYDETRLTIMDSWVHHNESDAAGAGVYAEGYGTYVRNSTVEHNTAGGEGGGFYVYGDLILVGSTLQYNHSQDTSDGGGGIYAYGDYAGLVISDTLVYSNTTEGYGGGLSLYEDGGVFVSNSIFRENRAEKYGGGIYMYEYAGLVVEDSSFEDNKAEYGGAVYSEYENGVTVERSTFSGNRATEDGGAFYLYEETPADIRNSTFSQNHADGSGGAIYAYEYNFGIQSSTIVRNSAGTSGGGIYVDDYATAQNSIIAGNSAGGSASAADADCSIGTAFYSGGNNLLGDGTGCEATRYDQAITTGTIFASVLGPLADNGGPELPDGSHPKTHALLNGSPAVDAANDDLCPDVDERGVDRPKGNACDIGAFESTYTAPVPSPTHNIIAVTTFDDELNADNDCSLREAVQATNTDAAVDQCKAGDGWDTITLPAGTYNLTIAGADEDANASGDLDIITSSVTIRGAGSATTIIDGNELDRVLDVLDESMLLLEGVTITKGKTPANFSIDGGCIQSGDGLFVLLNTVVSLCESSGYGGGIYMELGVGRLVNTVVKENISLEENGGIYNDLGTLSIEDSTIISNTAADYGGGVMSYYGVTRLSASIVQGNVLTDTDSNGGGIYHYVGNLILDEGTRVMNNTAGGDGGGVYAEYGALKVEDSTVSHNRSSGDGGGIGLDYTGLWMRASLIEYNTAVGDGAGGNYVSGLIEDSTIRHNETITGDGGGLDTWAVILNSTISGNKAAQGGGIWAEGVNLYNSVVKDNTALDGDGGGMHVQSSSEYGGAIIVDSTVSGNKGHVGDAGAGVYADTMPVTARGSTFSGNSGADLGGGIYSHEGVVDLLNSTVSGNSASEGAGIHVLSGTVSLNYSTVADNAASSEGGGVYNAQTTVFENSIVAGNKAGGSPSNASADCKAAAPIAFGGYSLFGDSTGCAAEGRGDQTGAPATVFTAMLRPLANNGGPATASGDPTWTHALLPASPALDAIAPGISGCQSEVKADQRGISRPQGDNCDIGAFELGGYKVYLPIVLRQRP